MELAFYFYTILLMLACIAAGTITLSAYFVSRKRSYLFVVTFFLFYFLDLALIFQYEYLGQNTVFPLEEFYSVGQPVLKTLFAVGALESIWLIVCNFFDKRHPVLLAAPPLLFIGATLAALALLPEGEVQQWLFYSLRQVFLLWLLGYAFLCYRRAASEVERVRIQRQRPLFLVTLVLVLCVLVEDAFMILLWTPDPATSVSLFPLYLSERNFSENLLMLAFAFFSLREAAATLRLRFKEPPAAENPTTGQQINNLLPPYCERHELTNREHEILFLVLQGKDNQNIASELHLALGTVKAHVHNILKKTGHADRGDLTRDFWRE